MNADTSSRPDADVLAKPALAAVGQLWADGRDVIRNRHELAVAHDRHEKETSSAGRPACLRQPDPIGPGDRA